MAVPARPPIALVDMDIRSREGLYDAPALAGRLERVDCYALAETDLSRFAALIVPAMVDQEYLARHAGVIAGFLDTGGVVVFGGHLHRPWLPGTSAFVPLDVRSFDAYRVDHVADHPIFAGVDPSDLTFRRGVAGFFARGHHPLPDHPVEVLTRLSGGEPATYVDRHASRGTVLLQASGDLLGYAGLEGSTAARIPAQLLDWAITEAGRRRAERHPAADGRSEDHEALSENRHAEEGGQRTARRPEAAAAGGFGAGRPAVGTSEPATENVENVEDEGSRSSVQDGAGAGLAAVYGGSAQHHRAFTSPKYARYLSGGTVYLPALADTDLTGHAGLIIPERLHRGLLTRAAPRILALLEAGGTVVTFAGGEPLPEFLPGVRFEARPTNYWWWLERGADLGLRTPVPDHPLFDHVALSDCTWHYHGALDPPAGADVLVTLPGGEALLYVDRVSTPGTLIVSTLDPLSHYGSYFMPATERFLDGFLPWLAEDVVDLVSG